MLKTVFDYVTAVIGLVVLSPLLLITGLLIRILMPGRVFFVQQRVGKEGKEIGVIKFRTMEEASGTEGGDIHIGDYSRVTPLGKILRRTKIDELPQLINVLRGEMSVVGPRPEVRKWTSVYPDLWAVVHRVKPGVTDSASVEFVNEEKILAASPDPERTYREEILPRKLELYVSYVNNHSFAGDLRIILHTIKAVITGR